MTEDKNGISIRFSSRKPSQFFFNWIASQEPKNASEAAVHILARFELPVSETELTQDGTETDGRQLRVQVQSDPSISSARKTII